MDLTTLGVSLLIGSMSIHTTTTYEPANGYNSNHHTIGLEVLQDEEGVTNGVQAFKYRDSFNIKSEAYLYSLGYTKRFKSLYNTSLRCGVAAGYTKTSYYDGALAMPFCGVMFKRVGLDVGYIPPMKHNDGVLMFQAKIKLN